MANPFQTPVTEQSFSGLIDAAILATGKPMQLAAATQFANLVVRECQALGLFARDLIEDALIATASPHIWTRPYLFRSLRAVQYPGWKRYPKLALPGRKQGPLCDYFYAADNYFVFAGINSGDTIKIATYFWQKPLGYYGRLGTNTQIFPGGPYPVRPAFYDLNSNQWMYLNTAGTAYVSTTGSPVTDELMQEISSNWLTSDWYDLILSGTKTKIWNSGGDPRGNTEYGVYKQLQKVLQNSTQYEAEDM